MRRWALAAVSGPAIAVLGLAGLVAGPAVATAAGTPPVQLNFDDAARQVTLTIPTPPCPSEESACKWILFVNEPKAPGKPVVGTAKGTTGVLTVAYPSDFCGIIQADARTGPPWTQVYGQFHTIKSGCTPPSPPTTQAPAPPPAQLPATAPPAVVAATDATSPTTSTEPPVATNASATTTPVDQLPFTGADIALLAWFGLTGIVTGAVLLIRRRRSTS